MIGKERGVVLFLLFTFLLAGVFSVNAQPPGGRGGTFTTEDNLDVRAADGDTNLPDVPEARDISALSCSQLTATECVQQSTRCEIQTNPSNGQQSCINLRATTTAQQTITTQTITPPTGLTATLSGTNVVLTWNKGNVVTTTSPAGFAVLDNQITGNAGLFDSIANFFRSIFGLGARGTALTQQNLVYDVWRKEAGDAYGILREGITCPPNLPRCSYTDNTAQAGKSYTYKVGVRTSSELYYENTRFSNEVSVSVPVGQAVTTAQTCAQKTTPRTCSRDSKCTWNIAENICDPKTTRTTAPALTTAQTCAQRTTQSVCSQDGNCEWNNAGGVCRDKTSTPQTCAQKTTPTTCSQDSKCTWNAADNLCETKSTAPALTTKKALGQPCTSNADCTSNNCQYSTAQATEVCTVATTTTTAQQTTAKKANGQACAGNSECQSGLCQYSTSQATEVCTTATTTTTAQQTTQIITPPTELTSQVISGNVVLTWNKGEITTTTNPISTSAVIEQNRITGNAGLFDSIANFFRSIFGLGARGTALTQQNLVYDVWRKEAGDAYGILREGITCPPNLPRCSYTDNTAQAGKSYTYKVGVRTSSELYYENTRFSNEVSVSIPATVTTEQAISEGRVVGECAPTKPLKWDGVGWIDDCNICGCGGSESCNPSTGSCSGSVAGKTCNQLTPAECNTQSSRCQIVGSACTDKTAPQATYNDLDFNNDGGVDIVLSGSNAYGADGLLFTQHVGTTTSSSNWDARYDLDRDGDVDYDDFYKLAELLPQIPEPTAEELAIPTDVSLRYDIGANSIVVQWKDEGNYVTVATGRKPITYIISREVDGSRSDDFATAASADLCTSEVCTFTDSIDIRENKEYIYRIRARMGELRGLFTTGTSIRITPACTAVGGAGCTSVATNGENVVSAGNDFCNSVGQGSVCVSCAQGFSWDSTSGNCLLGNPKANGETCTSNNECASRVCSSNVCSAAEGLYDLNDDNCVDVLDLELLNQARNNPSTVDLAIHDLNSDGKVDNEDLFIMSDNGGYGDSCPIVKGDFDNNRCIDNNDKAALKDELAKPVSDRRSVFDLNGDNAVSENDEAYLREKYRTGGKCSPITPLPGDVNNDRCVDTRDMVSFASYMRVGGTGIVNTYDMNDDNVLDADDIDVIRNSFGGDNCQGETRTYGDFNNDGRVEITIGEGLEGLSGADGILFREHMGTNGQSENWDAAYDLNGDGKVDTDDFFRLSDLFGIKEERVNFNSQSGSRVNLLDSKIRLIFSPKEQVNTDIIGRYLSHNPESNNLGGKVGLNFIDISSVQPLTGKLEQVNINVVYDDQDVQRLGLVEGSLRMYYFNDETQAWELLPGTVDTTNNLVSGIASHLSVYGLFGDNVVVSPPDDTGGAPPAGGGGGTSGGSGGGATGRGSTFRTLLVQNSQTGDCKRISEYTLPFWQSKGYNTVDQCLDTVPTTPSGGQVPTIDDYRRGGVEQVNIDVDQDGLIDDLEIQFFGSLNQGFEDDFDQDGISNGKEFADGTDPTNAEDFKTGGGTGKVLLIILILVLIGAIGSIIWLKKQGKIGGGSSSKNYTKGPGLTGSERKIVKYIEDARSAGMKTSDIRVNLSKAGWTKEQINNAFSSIG